MTESLYVPVTTSDVEVRQKEHLDFRNHSNLLKELRLHIDLNWRLTHCQFSNNKLLRRFVQYNLKPLTMATLHL